MANMKKLWSLNRKNLLGLVGQRSGCNMSPCRDLFQNHSIFELAPLSSLRALSTCTFCLSNGNYPPKSYSVVPNVCTGKTPRRELSTKSYNFKKGTKKNNYSALNNLEGEQFEKAKRNILKWRKSKFEDGQPSESMHWKKARGSNDITKKNMEAQPKPEFKEPVQIQTVTVASDGRMTLHDICEATQMKLASVKNALKAIKHQKKKHFNCDADHMVESIEDLKKIIEHLGFKAVTPQDKGINRRPPPDPAVLVKRAPVVTIMGHVDHGKTTLLDALRNTNVVAQEFGGITQHIGAFQVTVSSGDVITFLDTPGHAAFAKMRARGAMVTDIVVLVVAAEDGVMEQTIESIMYAKEAKVPIIVAINKIDKPSADVEATKNMLSEHGLVSEEFKGDTQFVPISALKKINLDKLQEAILVESEIMELKGDPTGLVEGIVIESNVDPQRGKIATVLIQRGVLKPGGYLVAGKCWGKVRYMLDHRQQPIRETSLSMPVQVVGWKELPEAGAEVIGTNSEKEALSIVEWNQEHLSKDETLQMHRDLNLKRQEHRDSHSVKLQKRLEMGRYTYGLVHNLEEFAHLKKKQSYWIDSGPSLNLVVKGDVAGSVETLLSSFGGYQLEHLCPIKIIHSGVGDITLRDLEMAETFNGVVFGFQVTAPVEIVDLAEKKEIPLKLHQVIYHLFDDLKDEIVKKIPLVNEDKIIGKAEVMKMFKAAIGKHHSLAAGCYCSEGILDSKKHFQLIREDEVVHEGQISNLRHFQSKVQTIKQGMECGLTFDDPKVQVNKGDIIVCFERQQKRVGKDDLDFGF
ncbi:translation initiation factor IF-2, mitochondrial isoform X2 [Lingula anatina]|nr:translation initiation factor IF-2, mitochondrial isoform X2 [Lingula anatina]XP_013402706.1 translation initiation factor IF-2, mitochondrial isoform X2 [Lingula anatina]XP_013402707.1 translation initiation factor IF-2, mitochondrial isoform X2 [Lingula anatina]|eukprot:XP_013402705.1 translation initiation factor IF-2, mitochondrial isoform X2 [Lingula anatina]